MSGNSPDNFNPCDNEFCPGGNCVGCKNGEVWCQDPACQPYCATCAIRKGTDTNASMVIIIILICLIAILFIVWFVYGPDLFEQHNDHERAGVIMPAPDTTATYV